MQVTVGINYGSYEFDATAGVITLLDLPTPLIREQLKLIVNARTNTIIFNLADVTQTATIVGNSITLNYNTTSMNNSDPLQIFMEVPGEEVLPEQTSQAPVLLAIAGLTADSSPKYKEIPLTINGTSVKVDGSATTQPISGIVSISNLPSSQHVTVDNTITSVNISNLPSIQTISGTVDVSSVDGTVTSASDGPTGADVPLNSSFIGYNDANGHLIGVGTSTPLPITGSVSTINTSVGIEGAASPADSTQIGFSSGGNLTVPSTSNPLPVSVVSGEVTVANPSIPVTGTFWQATQPVSISGTVPISGSISVSNFPSSQAVTGVFWQATQPVSSTQLPTTLDGSGNLKVAIENSSIAVTGAFYQATQPVSGTVTANISGSVSNTAFGVTGDVAIVNSATGGKTKIAVTADAITFASPQHVIVDSATLGTVAVSGSFYQTTQPISGSVSITGTPTISGTVNQGTSSSGALWSVQVDNSTAIAVADSAAETSLSTLAGAVTGAQLQVNVTNASVPVTGTFYQGTQPVSFTDNTVLDTSTITLPGTGSTYTASGFNTYSFQFAGDWAGAVVIQGSNDNSNWISLWSQNSTDGTMVDVILNNGIYSVPVVTPYMRYLVSNVVGRISLTVIGKLAAMISNPLLSQALDSSTGVQLNTNIVNLSKDTNNALILSDAPAPIVIGGGTGIGGTITIDTQGYQSLNITTQAMAANVTCSNDKVTWSALTGAPLVFGTLVSAVAANTGYSFPCIARFIRFTVTTTGGATVFLRNTPWQGNYTTTGPTSSLTTNVATWAGTAGPSAGVAGVVAIGGNINVGAAQTAFPLVVGGIDAANLTRRLQTDALGRPIIASIDPSNNTRNLGSVSPGGTMQNIAALAVQDLTQFEGQSIVELMAQILSELKILNYYTYNMPGMQMNSTGFQASDEPQVLRMLEQSNPVTATGMMSSLL